VNRLVSILGAFALGACNNLAGEENVTRNDAGEAQANVTPRPANNLAGNAVLPDDRTPLAEPRGPINPKSAEAAGQIVQHYGALIEQKRMGEAAKLWSSAESASDFAAQLRRYSEVHLEISRPSEPEGAAGSVYVSEPVVIYGKDENGNAFRRGANVTLRRVNDVPGSTEEQRRWNIERIEWAGAR
jgi:hypothetical protein